VAVFRTLERPTGLGPGDHVCWAFDEEHPFAPVAARFLAEGGRRGERLCFVADGDVGTLEGQLRAIPGREAWLESGQLTILPLAGLYDIGDCLDPLSQIEVFRKEASAALDQGFTGLRCAADLTSLAKDPAGWPHLRAYELAVDAMLATSPATCMCGYDGERVTATRLRPLAALHGQQHPCDGRGTFAVSVGPDVAALLGEVDRACAADLGEVFAAVEDAVTGPMTLDLAGLGFLDIGSCRVLAEFSETMLQTGRPVRFTGVQPAARRCLELFELDLT
jgi:anti-anti-sigma regulatory factor